MISLLMRADEQADPTDRPLPVANDRLDVRDRVFGKDLAVLHAAEVAPRLPKV